MENGGKKKLREVSFKISELEISEILGFFLDLFIL